MRAATANVYFTKRFTGAQLIFKKKEDPNMKRKPHI